MAKRGRPKVKFTKNEKAFIVELYRCGKTDQQVADLIGTPRTTLMHRLGQNELVDTIKEAKTETDDKVKECLLKRATGYKTTETRTETKIVEVMGPDGKTKVQRPMIDKVTKIDKEIIPDVGACAFWLKNRQPEKWREKSQVEIVSKSQLDEEVKTYLEENGEEGIIELFEQLGKQGKRTAH